MLARFLKRESREHFSSTSTSSAQALGLSPRRPAGPASYPSFLDFPPGLPRTAARLALAALLLAGVGTVAAPAPADARPLLESAKVDGRALSLTFDETLDTGSVPAADAFTANVESEKRTVSSVAVSGSEVTLTLTESTIAGETVTVSYNQPRLTAIEQHQGRRVYPLQNLSGRQVWSFTNQPVTNDSPVCPTGQPATNSWEACLTIETGRPAFSGYWKHPYNSSSDYGKLSDDTTDQGWKLVSLRYSAYRGLFLSFQNNTHETSKNMVLQIGSKTFDLADAAYIGGGYLWKPADLDWSSDNDGDKVSVSLKVGSVDVAPQVQSATVNGDTLELTFDEDLNSGSVPAKGAFDVEVAGNDRSLASANAVAISGSTVTLRLSSAVNHGQAVTVDYDKPGSNPLEDASTSNSEVGDFKVTVVNETPDPLVRSLVFDPPSVTVREAGTAVRYTVKLDQAPDAGNPVEVSVAEADITYPSQTGKLRISPSSFSLDTTNWETGQEVTLTARRDADGGVDRAILRHRGELVKYDDHNDFDHGAHLLVTIIDTNAPPRVANRIPRQTLTAGEPFSYTFPENTFRDPDGDTLTYSAYRFVDHHVGAVWPSWLSFDASTRTFSGTPLRDDVGFYRLTVTARDGYAHRGAAYGNETFVISVHRKVTGEMNMLSDENARLDGVSPRHPLGPVRMFANSLLETIIPVAHADEGTCELTVGIRFTDSDGGAVAVDSLSASDLSVENGQISNLAEHGDGWRVTLTSHVGFSGVMRLRILPREPADIPDGDEALAELSDEDLLIWDEAELVVRVSDGNCERVVTTGSALTGVTVFDSADDSELGQVPNGGSISLEEGGSYSFRADVEPDSDVGSVVLSLDAPDNDDDVDRTDDDAPYTVDAQSLSAGTYTLTATAYAGDGGEGAVRGTVVATIEIAEAGVLTGFVLVDASNDTDLGAVTSGATVEVSADGSYGIRAGVEADAEVGSVVLSLAGPGADDTHTQTENLAPYSLYGDAGGAEHGRGLAAGSYTLSATAYAERGGTGEELGTLSVAFTVAIETAPPPSSGVLTGFVLVDASDQSTVAALSSGSAIDLGGRSGGSFGIRAKVASGEAIGSVALSLSGAKTVSRTENLAPYSLYGDHNDGNGGRALDGSSLPAGSYTLSATAYAGRGASGSTLGTRSVSFRVLAPAALSVADARAEEGTDATLDFAVTLDRSSTGTVTVAYATADGTATAGDDYTATSGTLTFSAGETAKTVSVPVLDDDVDEGSETLRLVLSSASGASIADGEGTGTITNSDAMPRAWLARFGRTVTGQVLGAVEERLTGPRRAAARMSLAGQALPLWRDGDAAAANDGGAGERREDAESRAVLASMAARLARTGADSGSMSGAGGGGTAGLGADGGLEPRWRALTGRDLIAGTSFALTGGGREGGGFVSLWGGGSVAGFDGGEGSLTVDGEVTTGLIGADWSSGSGSGRWTAGLAVGHSTGTGGYGRGGECEVNCGGGIDATLTGLYPYAGIDLTDRVSLWAAAGWGSGEVEVTPADKAGTTADLTMSTGAAGLRGAVLGPGDGNGLTLAVKGDARFTRISSEAVRTDGGNLEAADADVWLVRTGVEGSRRFALGRKEAGASITPSFEIGLRLDGGDAETGMGADLGGGVAFADPAHGLAVDMQARGLVAHEASGFREWGASLSGSWDPRPASDRGLSLSLRQSWGAATSGGMDALLSRETLAGLAANGNGSDGFESSSRLEGELGYGLAMFGGGFTGTPNVGFGLSDGGARDWRIGWRQTSALRGGPGFEVSFDATRREPANGPGSGSGAGSPPEHGVTLRAMVRW